MLRLVEITSKGIYQFIYLMLTNYENSFIWQRNI